MERQKSKPGRMGKERKCTIAVAARTTRWVKPALGHIPMHGIQPGEQGLGLGLFFVWLH